MTLLGLRDLLVGVTENTFHFDAEGQKGNYIVWGEDGPGEVIEGDDKVLSQGIVGTIIYYTLDEFDPKFLEIERKLNDAWGIEWALEQITFNKAEGYIVYLWTFEITISFEEEEEEQVI